MTKRILIKEISLAALVVSIFLATTCFAAPAGTQYVGLGIFNQNLLKVTDQPSAETSTFGEMNAPLLHWRGYFSVFEQSLFSPRISYSLLPRASKDGAAEITHLLLSLPVTSNLENDWEWSYGMTFILQTIKGQGGTVTLKNGTTTAQFYRPAGTSSSSYFSADIGFGKKINNFHINFDLMIPGLLTDRRAIQLFITIGYQLGMGGY